VKRCGHASARGGTQTAVATVGDFSKILGVALTDFFLKCSAETKIPPKVLLTERSVHLALGLLITLTFISAILAAMRVKKAQTLYLYQLKWVLLL
jgi:hypothetical protein